MKSSNYAGLIENDSGSDIEVDIDEQEKLMMDVMAKPLRSSKEQTDSNRKQGENSGSIEGVVIGKVITCDNSGTVTVDYPGNPSDKPLVAATLSTFGVDDINKKVALMFETGNPRRPVIMGRLQRLVERVENNSVEEIDIKVDGKRLTFNAAQEIVLRCGAASITLTKAGKVLIRGEYLLSRSTGTNRIKGGSVQIN